MESSHLTILKLMMSFLVGAVATCIMTLGYGGAIGGHGHAGIDYACGYFTPVYSPYEGTVIYRDDTEGSLGLIAGTSSPKLFVVGHMATTTVAVGDRVERGEVLGKEGYKGEAYYDGRRENSPAASHRHYAIYPLVPESAIRSGEFYIFLGNDWYKDEGSNYLRIRDPKNGYAGACDPLKCL